MTYKHTTWAYVAGLIEGEGCFSNSRGTPRVEITSTDVDVLLRLQELTGMGTIVGPYEQRGPFGKKPHWRWRVQKRAHFEALCRRISPWLGERRLQQMDKSRAG